MEASLALRLMLLDLPQQAAPVARLWFCADERGCNLAQLGDADAAVSECDFMATAVKRLWSAAAALSSSMWLMVVSFLEGDTAGRSLSVFSSCILLLLSCAYFMGTSCIALTNLGSARVTPVPSRSARLPEQLAFTKRKLAPYAAFRDSFQFGQTSTNEIFSG